MRVLMVCLGNICRSPLAEGILKSKTNSDVFIDSAGTGGWHVGQLPDARSIAVARIHGLDITNQRCRRFEYQDFENFDIIYAMDQYNYSDILSLAQSENDKQKVRLILTESGKENTDVPDPYHDSERGFENVYQMLDDACEVIANKIDNNEL